MGVYIYTGFNPDKMSPEKWKEIYEDSLKLASDGGFAETGVLQLSENTVYAWMKTVEKKESSGKRNDVEYWHMTGTLTQGSQMEDHSMARDLSNYSGYRGSGDEGSILAEFLSEDDCKKYGISPLPLDWVFSDKTQGRDGHLHLLAISLLITDVLPHDSFAYGDITFGQLIRAQKIVKDVLGKDVMMPIQYNLPLLLDEIDTKLPKLSKRKKLYILFEVYEGDKNDDFWTFVKDCFAGSVIKLAIKGFCKDMYLKPALEMWLGTGLALDEFCEFAIAKNGMKEEPCDVIKACLKGKLTEEDKLTYDVTKAEQDNGTPDSIEMLMTRVFAGMAGLRNPAIPYYIPEADMIKAFRKVFGDETDELIKKASSEIKSDKANNTVKDFYDTIYERAEAWDQKEDDEFIYRRVKELCYWSDGEPMTENLEEVMIDAVKQIRSLSENHDVYGYEKKDRIQFLANQFSYRLPLPEETWRFLDENVMDDDIYRRYVGLCCVNTDTQGVYDLVSVLRLNKKLYDYFWGKIE